VLKKGYKSQALLIEPGLGLIEFKCKTFQRLTNWNVSRFCIMWISHYLIHLLSFSNLSIFGAH